MNISKELINLTERVASLEVGVKDLVNDVKEIKETMNGRIPLWITFVLSFLMAVIGWLLSFILKL